MGELHGAPFSFENTQNANASPNRPPIRLRPENPTRFYAARPRAFGRSGPWDGLRPCQWLLGSQRERNPYATAAFGREAVETAA